MAPKTARMIFNAKPNKDKHKPESFSPISLLEVTGKVSNRLNYVAFNYLFTEKQFSFRTHRGTQHSINIISDAVDSLCKQSNLPLIATRDVHKAFDNLWHNGLI